MEKLANMSLPKMRRELFDDHCHRGPVGEGNWLSLIQFAAACRVDAAWLGQRIADGMFPGIEFEAGKWRVFGDMVLRARLARQLESDFGMLPFAQKNNP